MPNGTAGMCIFSCLVSIQHHVHVDATLVQPKPLPPPRTVTHMPTRTNGANSFTFPGRSSTTSTRFVPRSFVTPRRRPVVMQASPPCPSTSVSSHLPSSRSLSSISPVLRKFLLGTNRKILRSRSVTCCSSTFRSRLVSFSQSHLPTRIWPTQMG